jgi:hypothetical protein
LQNDSFGQIEYNGIVYYIVTVSDLMKARKGPPTYVGTIQDHHLFRTWLKVKKFPDEISFFAVIKNSCVIIDAKSPEEEKFILSSKQLEHRKVEFENGKCSVGGH